MRQWLTVALLALANAFPVEQIPLVSRNLIDSDKLQALITEDALRAGAETLYEAAKQSIPKLGHPTRAIGTEGHNATLEYIFDELDSLDGFDVQSSIFIALSGRIHNFTLSDSDGAVKANPLRMTPPGNATAPLVRIEGDGCLNSEFYGVKGKIALVKRGKCSFGEKSEAAGQFGALGVLLWDPEEKDDALVAGELGTPMPDQVPTLFVTKRWATNVKEGAEVSVDVDSEVFEIPTVNIIAESKSGDHDNVVMAGAHSDSVPSGPGINDNGSGTVALLEIARQLNNFELVNAVRLAWWSAEEVGLKGSLDYTQNLVASEAQKIRLFLDYDMLASPNYVNEIYDSDDKYGNPEGSSLLRDTYIDYLKERDIPWVTQPFDGRSDYVGFLEIGVPASGLDAGAEELKTADEARKFGGTAGEAYDKCYHEACDNLENINYDAWVLNTKLAAHSIAKYARSLEGFPKRKPAFGVRKSRREYSLF